MRYIVLADHGTYIAGQVLDLGDAEAASTLIRRTGVPLLPLAEASPATLRRLAELDEVLDEVLEVPQDVPQDVPPVSAPLPLVAPPPVVAPARASKTKPVATRKR